MVRKKKINVRNPEIYAVKIKRKLTDNSDIELLEHCLMRMGLPPLSFGMKIAGGLETEPESNTTIDIIFSIFKAGILAGIQYPTLFELEKHKSLSAYVEKYKKDEIDKIKKGFG